MDELVKAVTLGDGKDRLDPLEGPLKDAPVVIVFDSLAALKLFIRQQLTAMVRDNGGLVPGANPRERA